MGRKSFIEEISVLIQKYIKIYGYPFASPIIAQACLESGYGKSELAVNANNFFGIKYTTAKRVPSSKGYYVKVGRLEFQIMEKELEENQCDIKRGDYIGLQVTPEHMEYFIVTDDGRVWSKKSQRYLTPTKSQDGYLRVKLCYGDGKYINAFVHRIVAKVFIPNPDNLPQINHKNEDKTDNRLSNLELLSHKDNINYTFKASYRQRKSICYKAYTMKIPAKFILCSKTKH